MFWGFVSSTVCRTSSGAARMCSQMLWDLHWKRVLSPGATGPPSLFHGYLDTHSPEWRHAALNPGICDPATDRHSIGTDSIKLQIKAGTSKQPVRKQHGDVTGGEGGGCKKWVRGVGEKIEKPSLYNPRTWQSLIQINICEWCSVATMLVWNILAEDESIKVVSLMKICLLCQETKLEDSVRAVTHSCHKCCRAGTGGSCSFSTDVWFLSPFPQPPHCQSRDNWTSLYITYVRPVHINISAQENGYSWS